MNQVPDVIKMNALTRLIISSKRPLYKPPYRVLMPASLNHRLGDRKPLTTGLLTVLTNQLTAVTVQADTE